MTDERFKLVLDTVFSCVLMGGLALFAATIIFCVSCRDESRHRTRGECGVCGKKACCELVEGDRRLPLCGGCAMPLYKELWHGGE